MGKSTFNPCDINKPVEVASNDTETVLSINSTVKNTSCIWTCNGFDGTLVFFVEERLRLNEGDVFTVTQGNLSLLNLTVGSDIGSKLGVFITKVKGDFNLTLKLNDKTEPKQRVFGIKLFLQKDKNPLPIPLSVVEHHVYHIPLTNITNAVGQPTDSVALTFQIGPKGLQDWSDKRLVIEAQETIGNIKYRCESSESAADGYDCLADKPGLKSNLVFTDFDYGKSRLTFTIDLVDDVCSGFTANKIEEFAVDTNRTEVRDKQSLNCLKIVSFNQKGVRLDFSKLGQQLLGSSDVLTIRDGGKEFGSNVALQIHSGNIQDISNTLLNNYINSNVIRISYVSHYFGAGESVKIGISLDTKSKVDVTGSDVDTTVAKDDNDPLFVMTADTGFRASFTPKNNPKTDVYLYSSNEKSSAPFAVIPKGKVLPTVAIVSPTNILRIVPAEKGVESLQGRFNSYNGSSVTLSGDSGSLVLKSVDALTNSSSWFIPAKAGNGVFELSIERLTLPHDKACLTVDQLTDKSVTIVSECFSSSSFDSNNGQRYQFPTMKLNAQNSYLVTYSLGSNGSVNSSVLFSGSVYYVDNADCDVKVTLSSDQGSLVEPNSYPGSLPLWVKEQAASGNCKWLLNTTLNGNSSFVHTVFYDIDLKADQSLAVSAPNEQARMYNSTSIGLPDDVLSRGMTTLLLQSTIPAVGQQSLRTASGRGFRAVVQSFECGGTVDVSTPKTITTPGYPSSFNGSSCLWMIFNSKTKENPIIQFSKTFGSSPAGDYASFANLSFYDGSRTGDLRFVNVSNTNTSKYNSSTNVMFVEYKLLDSKKPAPGLQVNLTAISKFSVMTQLNFLTCILFWIRLWKSIQ
jgi:hypothetical protein